MKKKNYYLRVIAPKQRAKKNFKSDTRLLRWVNKNKLSDKELDRIIEDLVCN
ncbi:MAG: hypothetical protein U1C12_01120 [Patescibacteria group bacterium]|nr:hypothetical protein [Patescibacteria group bacterium]